MVTIGRKAEISGVTLKIWPFYPFLLIQFLLPSKSHGVPQARISSLRKNLREFPMSPMEKIVSTAWALMRLESDLAILWGLICHVGNKAAQFCPYHISWHLSSQQIFFVVFGKSQLLFLRLSQKILPPEVAWAKLWK